ncbi:hypothetical protein DFH08DRAFT_1086636 [Mycena albidolilacea]|uniref:Uncharacterized protein n=1 Tax=Mycena albidolilacea TaxID=1033008 RepID=A0AAD7EFW2_9AGAR|nr:hypothetical protein DFH08DRAFT_1086636 [Mycena albidolilacea]
MSFPHFRSTSSQLHQDSDENASMRDSDSAETLLHSAIELLKMSREGTYRIILQIILNFVSLILHSMLVGIHLALLTIWAKELEHGITFSLDNQKMMNFPITAIANTLGTIYSAVLVFVTQRLWTRRSLRTHRTLTATHDSAAAWTGIGSALVQLWSQRTTPRSIIGVLSVFLYLANILVLHITTPALFTFEIFNSTRLFNVATRSLPSLDSFSQVYWSNLDNASTAILGLKDGTLYDVIDVNSGAGNVTVDATGFGITCGYLTGIDINAQPTGDSESSFEHGMIRPLFDTLFPLPGTPNFVDFYSTIPIIDSNKYLHAVTNVAPPLDTFANPISSLQVFRCSQSLVKQKAVVDVHTRQILAVEPDIHKTTSTWLPHTGQNDTTFNATDNWHWLYADIPQTTFDLDAGGNTSAITTSIADIYLNKELTLQPAGEKVAPRTVKLHDLENTLSSIIASMFWTLGHIPPQPILVSTNDSTIQISASDSEATTLRRGNAEFTEVSTQWRLDSDIIATAGGLAASVAPLLLSLQYYLSPQRHKHDPDHPIDGTGILQALWLFRHHPELETQLDQVENPTEANLREAGIVRTRLVGTHRRRRGSSELF